MLHKSFVLCSAAALVAIAVACSKSSQSPLSPNNGSQLVGEAAADGSNLKVTKPTPQSPVNGAQPSSLTLVAGTSSALFPVAPIPALTYEFQVLTNGGSVINACTTMAASSGPTVSASPLCLLEFDVTHKWRIRARFGSAFGSWAEATFKAPLGGRNDANGIYDPLYNGTTVGQRIGPTEFVPNQGIELLSHDSRVSYRLDPTMEQGELSVMATGYDEGSPGDKTKIFAMQEGNDGSITDNDYRMTVEKRGRSYTTPGAVTFRIITGDAGEEDAIHDGARIGVAFSDERWYFWKFTWQTGSARLQVREDGPNGRVIYDHSTGTGSHPYRPLPHYVHLGVPVGRAGPLDASIPGSIYKNLWVSRDPRPNLPNE